MNLVSDANHIIQAALQAAQPDSAVRRALVQLPAFTGRLFLVAAGKAAWSMAKAAWDALPGRIHSGIVITKYGHSRGSIGTLRIREAGHPVPDAASYAATAEALRMVQDLQPDDLVLFLLSGGASALLEQPLLPPAEMESITRQLLRCGAAITEINTLRKRFSGVKGGRFARLCSPALVFSVVLSDIIGDPLDMIASGPACPDSATCEQALAAAQKYDLQLSAQAWELLRKETPKRLDNVQTLVTGSVRQLCLAAEQAARSLGYRTVLLTDRLCCEAREAGSFLASIAATHAAGPEPLAFFAGGETIVHVKGTGMGGRNQELALAAAAGIENLPGALVFSVGSDGTDGPTDAAGGMVTGETAGRLRALGADPYAFLQNNDAYHALELVDALIRTGPTGTNVNDLSGVLLTGTQNS